MGFTFSTANIRENQIVFIYEDCADTGVRKIAGRVRADIAKIFGAKPVGVMYENFGDTAAFYSFPVFFGTVGKSGILDKLAAASAVRLFDIAGETEVYSLFVIDDLEFEGFSFESALVIAGSDRKGTIYGLFALAEMLGILPFSELGDAKIQKNRTVTLNVSDSFVSKPPSIKHRGFLTDRKELNEKDYNDLFELLLRFRGNCISASGLSEGSGDEIRAAAEELGITFIDPSSGESAALFDVSELFSEKHRLSYFMDKAFEADRWSAEDPDGMHHYTEHFVHSYFPSFTQKECDEAASLLDGCDGCDDAPSFSDSIAMLDDAENRTDLAERLLKDVGKDSAPAFFDLVYLPVTALLNRRKIRLLTLQNHVYALLGSTYANTLAEKIRECVKTDRKLTQKHNIPADDMNCHVIHEVIPETKPRLIARIPESGECSDGAFIELSTASEGKISFKMSWSDAFIDIPDPAKSVKCGRIRRVPVVFDHTKMSADTERAGAVVTIEYEGGHMSVSVPAPATDGAK